MFYVFIQYVYCGLEFLQMANQLFTLNEFWLLHNMMFVQRSKLLSNSETITKLNDVDNLYQKYKERRGLKKLYGYEGAMEVGYNSDSLFDVIVRFLVDDKKISGYNKEQFQNYNSLTRRLYLNYNFYNKNKNNDGLTITLRREYCKIYYDFLEVDSFQELKKKIEKEQLVFSDEVAENHYYRGHYYTEVGDNINCLLLKTCFETKTAEIFLEDSEKDARQHYQGELSITNSAICFELKSCEKGNNGRLFFLIKLGDNPVARFKKIELCFASYCSIMTTGDLSGGILGFEPIHDFNASEDLQNFNWGKKVPMHFEFLLGQQNIINQIDYKQTRIRWDIDNGLLSEFKKNQKDNLELYSIAKKKIQNIAGIYAVYSLSRNDKCSVLNVNYLSIDKTGNVLYRVLDEKLDVLVEYTGRILVNDSIYKISLNRVNRRIDFLLEHKNYSPTLLYGVYSGHFYNSIIGGRIMLKQLRANCETHISALMPKRIPFIRENYQKIKDESMEAYLFFMENEGDEYIGDIFFIKNNYEKE